MPDFVNETKHKSRRHSLRQMQGEDRSPQEEQEVGEAVQQHPKVQQTQFRCVLAPYEH